MGKNKIIYGSETLIDLTGDSVTADKVLSPFTFHGIDGEIHTGTCTYDSDTSSDTALVAEVLSGQTFHARGSALTGTMANNGAYTQTISSKTQSVSIPIGYHDGSGSVSISTTEKNKIIAGNIKSGITILGVQGNYSGESATAQSKTVTPTTSSQTVLPDANYDYLSQVTVNAIPYVETANAYGTTVTIG